MKSRSKNGGDLDWGWGGSVHIYLNITETIDGQKPNKPFLRALHSQTSGNGMHAQPYE